MEKKIAVIGSGMSITTLAALAATLPKSIQAVTVDQAQKVLREEQELEDATIRSINQMNAAKVEGEFSSLSNM